MMREIKFRGKQIDNDEWIYGNLISEIDADLLIRKSFIHLRLSSIYEVRDYPSSIVTLYEVYPDSVGQYVGLIDKNGTEIYEGDIVKASSQGSRGTFEVKWRQEASPQWILYPAWQSEQFWNLHGTKLPNGDYVDLVEVIGNKHDNPDLLKS